MQTFPSDAALLAHLEAHRVPAAPVIDPADAGDVAWFRERGAVTQVDDPVMGPVLVPGFPLHLSGQPRRPVEPPAPFLGQHNADVLAEVLGYDKARVDDLTARWGARRNDAC